MSPQWHESWDAFPFRASDGSEGFLLGTTFINLACIERIHFATVKKDEARYQEARLYRPGETEPAYVLDQRDSERLAHQLRQDIPPHSLSVRARAVNFLGRGKKDTALASPTPPQGTDQT